MPFIDASGLKPEDEPTYEELVALNTKRTKLLSLARDTSPIDTLLRLRLLPRTVVPRLTKHPLTYFIFLTYGIAATATRLSGIDAETLATVTESLEGGGTVVTCEHFKIRTRAPCCSQLTSECSNPRFRQS